MDVSPVGIEPLDAAWIAGILDGEGSISVSKTTKGRTRDGVYYGGPIYGLRLGVIMTSTVALEFFSSYFGGVVVPHKSQNKRQLYRWSVSEWRAVRVLATLSPYLRIKRRQAELAISFMHTKRREFRGRNRVSLEEADYRESVYVLMSLLNHDQAPE